MSENPYESPGLYLADCMEAMAHFPDGFFDLAVVDPPYGDAGLPDSSIGGVDGLASDSTATSRQRWNRFGGWFDRYKLPNPSGGYSKGVSRKTVSRTGGTWADKYAKKIIAWDVAPGQEYFDELFRVSRSQIIWGGNYFSLPPCRCFLVWKKLTISESFTMAMAEYAWTSFNSNAKVYECAPQGSAREQRFHPTQKPVALYQWILSLYAKPGMRILDTHAGSASSLVACHRAGLDAWGFEVDETYFDLATERLNKEKQQVTMLDVLAAQEPEQVSMAL